VQPPRAFVVHSEEEFRGRIDAEAKLARIAALCDDADEPGALAARLDLHRTIRAVLDGGAA
jgi:hypothetical protein